VFIIIIFFNGKYIIIIFHYRKYDFLQQLFLLQVAGKIILGSFTSEL
jgi:hypothetical protein